MEKAFLKRLQTVLGLFYVEKSKQKGSGTDEEMERSRVPIAEGCWVGIKTSGAPLSPCCDRLVKWSKELKFDALDSKN